MRSRGSLLDPPGAEGRRRRDRVERDQRRHGAPVVQGADAAVSGHGLSAGLGYESVGRVVDAGGEAGLEIGAQVFVPGARCFGPVRGLHGGAASHLVAPASRVVPLTGSLGEKAVLLALAATAFHALAGDAPATAFSSSATGFSAACLPGSSLLAGGKPPVVWEKNAARTDGAAGYQVTSPEDDKRVDYQTIFDVSGDSSDPRRTPPAPRAGGRIVLAGFYDRVSFGFPPAFMREARIRIAAAWRDGDLAEVVRLVETGRLSLEGLVTHRRPASEAAAAYPVAFDDPSCLKMVLDWRTRS